MSVDAKHPAYGHAKKKWGKVRAAYDHEVKDMLLEPEVGNSLRYKRYQARASYVNFTARTVNALIGAVTRKESELVLPGELEYLIESATIDALEMSQFERLVLSETLKVGRVGILVDYPQAEAGLTAAQVQARQLAARFAVYQAENIINWYEPAIDGKKQLSMVVLYEVTQRPGDDGFSWVEVPQYRVLTMVNGYYEQHLYNDEFDLIEIQEPRDNRGQRWEYIPFEFIGAENNNSSVDMSPIYDLAELNLKHYQNSADLEENAFKHGQGTMTLASTLDADAWNAANPGGVVVGAEKGLFIGEPGSKAELLQIQPNQVLDQLMERKETQALMIGARLITPQSGVETAEAARIRYSSENSVLATVVGNVSKGILACLAHAARFMGANSDDIEYNMNQQFYDESIDPQLIMAQIQLYDRGAVAITDVRDTARKAGLIAPDRADEDIDDEADLISPLGNDTGQVEDVE